MAGVYRSGAGLVAAGLILLQVAGCGNDTGLQGWIESMPSIRDFPIRTARVLSARPLYRVRWKIHLYGRHYRGTTPLARLESRLVSQGRYRDWHWRVEAPPRVVRSWMLWRRNAVRQGFVGRIGGRRTAYGWRVGFRRLYALVGRLGEGIPPPARITILLVPWQEFSKIHFSVTDRNAVPVVTAAWYPTTLRQSRAFQRVRFHALRAALADAGADLETVAVSARLPSGKRPGRRATDRHLEDADCWQTAIRVGLAARTPGRFATPGIALAETLDQPSTRSFLGQLAQAEHRHPVDPHVAALRADLQVLQALSASLIHEHLRWPVRGRDRPAIRSLVRDCADWTRPGGWRRGSESPRVQVK